ncbi:MAG: LysM peptidoglycan-binding domain-containing protein [Firmicutes bacterium]|nr:LysM peptidoglycan-binding domain-containing protein [Bacillota bacterium]
MHRLVLLLLSIGLFTSPAAADVEVYTVKPGDTIYAVARILQVHPKEIIALNSLDDPDLIGVGMQLKVPSGAPERPPREVTPEELELMAKVIYAEAQGEPELGQLAVGRVIVNRLRDPSFPDTITDVIYQPGQFLPVESGLPETVPAKFVELAKRAFSEEDPTYGALFFYNPHKTTRPDFWATRTKLVTIGNHVFAR